MDRKALVQDIIFREWDFFQDTNNAGGRASCQDSPDTFAVMRGSQFAAWSDRALESYLDDLKDALEAGRNPLMEKYAYMMESTHPLEFAGIKEQLPPVSERKRALVAEIAAAHVEWERECDRLYPHIRKQGRPLMSSEDRPGVTSFETYLKGELSTYSEATLEALLDHARAALADGVNLARVTLDEMVRGYGYASAEALERRKAGRD